MLTSSGTRRRRPAARRHGADRRFRARRAALHGDHGGPQFTFDEAVSFIIHCADQEQIDHYWVRLCDGGEEGPCGWLKDRYGLSWQVVPAGFDELMCDPDPARRDRAMRAVLQMKKLDVAAIYAAADGE